MVFKLGEPNSSLFLSEFSQLVRSNSNHQKTLLRFDPRGKSLSSSLLPSESSSALVIFGRRDKSPSTGELESISKVFPPFSVHFPSKGNATRFQIESLTLVLRVKVRRISELQWRCYNIPRYFYQEFCFSSKQ